MIVYRRDEYWPQIAHGEGYDRSRPGTHMVDATYKRTNKDNSVSSSVIDHFGGFSLWYRHQDSLQKR